MNQVAKYLIVGPSWVGDMVMAQSLFIDLKQREPDAVIHVLAPAWTSAIVDRMPEVERLIHADFKHGVLNLGARWRLGKSLRTEGYTQAIVLPNSLKSALVPFIARIPVRTGWVGEQRWGLLTDIRRLNKKKYPMTVQRFIALSRPASNDSVTRDELPAPRLVADRVSAGNLLSKFKLNLDAPVLALCPGAEFGESKQWPAERYAELVQYFLAKKWQVWILGSEKDRAVSHQINQDCEQRCHLLAGKTSLPEAVDLLSLANKVVSNDSGLMHISAALQRPLVAIYGSTDPGHTPPLSKNHKIARLNLDCSPCFKRTCPLQHLNCLTQLHAEQVIDLAESL